MTINPPQKLTLKAYAKVNLAFEVLGRRDDGYHDIASVIQTIDLCDTLTLEPADDITLSCDDPDLESPDNLVLKAAHLLRETTDCNVGAHITLQKAIPIAGGLGGGSSDAAAALKGLNRLWGLGLSVEELTTLAAEIGSDVPFFVRGGTAMMHGRGERIRPLPPADLEWLVLLCPGIAVDNKTASLYGEFTQSHYTRGALSRKLEARIRGGGDVPPQFLFNAFDDVAFNAFPGLEKYWKTFESMGAKEIHLSGSGPSMFTPISRKEIGTALHLLLKHRFGWNAYLVSTHQPSEGDE